jgi:SAM-dependent methyltransferase
MCASAISSLKQNVSFLLKCIKGYGQQRVCPQCGNTDLRLIDRKYGFARLFECPQCYLRFRYPLEDPESLESFYQSAYTQDDGITTHLPTAAEWEALVKGGFGEKNVDHYIALIQFLFPTRIPGQIRILDHGCSWGYQTWQFRSAGFECTGLEISKPRAAYGRERLGLPIYSELPEGSTGYDIFFSSHVIEHLPSPLRLLEEGFDLLRPGGFMIIESPNGSDEFRAVSPGHFHKLWGRVHPVLLSPIYYRHWLAGRPAFFTSWPFTDLSVRCSAWDRSSTQIDRLDGPSLLMVARKT